MSNDPPDFTKDVFPGRNYNTQSRGNQSKFKSPLLVNPGAPKFERRVPSPSRPNFINHNTNGIHNRLGPRSFYRNNNGIDNVNNNRVNSIDNRNNFNRKRQSDGNDAPSMPKRKWKNKRPQYYQNNFAQNRINRIRSQTDLNEPSDISEMNFINQHDVANDSQELDATDITVEVINHNVQVKEESDNVRFKMVLDPKTQAAIKVIQTKRRDKQVIFPYPVTPNVTEITLHERFTML